MRGNCFYISFSWRTLGYVFILFLYAPILHAIELSIFLLYSLVYLYAVGILPLSLDFKDILLVVKLWEMNLYAMLRFPVYLLEVIMMRNPIMLKALVQLWL